MSSFRRKLWMRFFPYSVFEKLGLSGGPVRPRTARQPNGASKI
jgi:hypothetical protein